VLLALFILIQVGALRYAYMQLGLGAGAAMLLLLDHWWEAIQHSIAELAAQQIVSGREITYFGMHYIVPTVVDWPGTVIAVNVGGLWSPADVALPTDQVSSVG